jgi:hypothetical protein
MSETKSERLSSERSIDCTREEDLSYFKSDNKNPEIFEIENYILKDMQMSITNLSHKKQAFL